MNIEKVTIEAVKTLRVKIVHDEFNESPREWDNLATLVCVHSTYNLGDENGIGLLQEAIESHPRYGTKTYNQWEEEQVEEHNFDWYDLADLIKVLERFEMHDRIYWEKIYLYDHGGITVATTPFSCSWDSGCVGIAFVTVDKVMETGYEVTVKNKRKTFEGQLNTPDFSLMQKLRGPRKKAVIEDSLVTLEAVASYIIYCEVKTYDQYLRGDVYGFICQEVWWEAKEDGSPDFSHELKNEEVDSCYGFYGYDPEENEMVEHWGQEFVGLYKKNELDIVMPF